MKKYIIKYAGAVLFALGIVSLSSCTKHFDTPQYKPRRYFDPGAFPVVHESAV